jgi:hypothetical protein
MPSNRKEFIYKVIRVPSNESLSQAIVQYWENISKTYQEHDRCLVFCRTLNDAKQLRQLLGVPCYHRECTDTFPIYQWQEGTHKILPTTLKLGCGFHYDHVRDVIHMNIGYSMVDQYQEDSRGGRDGLPCRVVMFSTETFRQPTPGEYDLGELSLYQWSFEKIRCLRIGPSLFLDNAPISCSLLIGGDLCANCTQQLSQHPPPVAHLFPIPKAPDTKLTKLSVTTV